MISLHLMHSHYSKRPTSLDFHFHLEFQMPYEQEKATLNADLCILNKWLSIVKPYSSMTGRAGNIAFIVIGKWCVF